MRYRKMKQRQRARLGSMGRKRDTMQRCGDVVSEERRHREGKGGDDTSWADKNLSGPKIEKIHMVDSDATNGQ
jgi:hypothetical protein